LVDFRRLLFEPARFLDENAKEMTLTGLAAFLIAVSAIFGILHGLDSYAFGNSKLGYLADMPSSRYGPPSYDVAAFGIRTGLAVAISRFVLAIALSAITYAMMRVLGSKAAFRRVLEAAVVLLAFPALIASFSVGLNVISYALLHNVSVLNASVAGAAGWLSYCILFGGRVRSVCGLSGWRAHAAVLPAASLAAAFLVWATLSAWFNLFFVDRISDSSIKALFGGAL